MATFPFLKPLEPLLVAHFGDRGAAIAPQLAEELTAALWRERDFRYVVIDGARGYVCDFRLYENPMIAAAAAQEVARGRVGTVILDRAADTVFPDSPTIKMATEDKTSPAHTPGPWTIACESDNPGEAFVIESDTRTIAWTGNTLQPDDAEVITEEDRANARLVAAAPELLEQCKMALADAEAAIANPSEVVDYNWPSIAEDLRAVIANAGGIPPETDHANAA